MTRPGRRWIRWIAVGLLTVVSLVLLRVFVYGLVGARLLSNERARAEAVFGPLDPDSLREPAVADDRNSVRAVRDALSAMGIDAEGEDWPRIGDPVHLPPELDLPALETRLAAASAELDRLATAAALPEARFGTFDESPPSRADDLLGWLRAARLSHLDGALALHTEDSARLERSLDTLHGLARSLRRGPLLLHALVANAIEGRFLDLLRAAVELKPSSSHLVRWRQQLETLQDLPGMKETLRGELGFAASTVAAQEEEGAGEFPPPNLWQELLVPISEAHFEAELYRTYRTAAELVSMPPDRRARAIPSRHSPQWRSAIDPTHLPGVIQGMMTANLIDAVERRSLATSVERLATISIDLLRVAYETGAYPDTLEDAGFGGPDLELDRGGEPAYRLRSDGGAELRLEASRRRQLELTARQVDDLDSTNPTGAAVWVRLCAWLLPPIVEEKPGSP